MRARLLEYYRWEDAQSGNVKRTGVGVWCEARGSSFRERGVRDSTRDGAVVGQAHMAGPLGCTRSPVRHCQLRYASAPTNVPAPPAQLYGVSLALATVSSPRAAPVHPLTEPYPFALSAHTQLARPPLRRQHYGADRCCLVVLGGQPLDTLQAMVQGSFAGVPPNAGGGPRPSFAQLPPPFQVRQSHCGTFHGKDKPA